MRKVLKGIAASLGKAEGKVRIVRTTSEALLTQEDEIIVVETGNPTLSIALVHSSGAICEKGGPLSHFAIICRESQKPCLMGVTNATKILKTGQKILLDSKKGIVQYDE